jgi:endoglucanase
MSEEPITRINQLLARTINVGLHLGDPKDERWCVRVTDREMDTIAKAGFSAVRLGVQWASHSEKATPFRIGPSVFQTVDTAIDCAVSHGLAVVVSNFLDPDLMENPGAYQARFLAITRQVAEHYRDQPETVLFEPMAEPRGRLDRVWNAVFSQGLEAVREQNPTRAVIVGPAAYNNARKLPGLELPDGDRNLIVTLHHYWPLKFTMQGEAWFRLPWFMQLFLGNPKSWPGTTWSGTQRQQVDLVRIFDGAAGWAKKHDRPIFIGEFGASSTADMPSRIRWAGFIRKLCEERGFSWGYWSFGPSFALYDFPNQQWHAGLLNALINREK